MKKKKIVINHFFFILSIVFDIKNRIKIKNKLY